MVSFFDHANFSYIKPDRRQGQYTRRPKESENAAWTLDRDRANTGGALRERLHYVSLRLRTDQ